MKHIGGYVTISDQMLQQARGDREAEKRWAERMDSDPEFRERWLRGQDEREDDWKHGR